MMNPELVRQAGGHQTNQRQDTAATNLFENFSDYKARARESIELLYSQPGPQFPAHSDFLGGEVLWEINPADMGVEDRAAFEIVIAEILAAQVGVAQVGSAQIYLGQVGATQNGPAQVASRKIDLLARGDQLLKFNQIPLAQTVERLVIGKAEFAGCVHWGDLSKYEMQN